MAMWYSKWDSKRQIKSRKIAMDVWKLADNEPLVLHGNKNVFGPWEAYYIVLPLPEPPK